MVGITITHNKIYAGTMLLATYTKDDMYIYITFEGDTYTVANNEKIFHNAIDSLCRYGILGTKNDEEATSFVICQGKNYAQPYNIVSVLFIAKCMADTTKYLYDADALYHTISTYTPHKDGKKFSTRKAAEEYMQRITNKGDDWFVVGI